MQLNKFLDLVLNQQQTTVTQYIKLQLRKSNFYNLTQLSFTKYLHLFDDNKQNLALHIIINLLRQLIYSYSFLLIHSIIYLFICVIQRAMSEVVYQQWKAYQGLLYEYYSDHVLTELPNITHSGWLNSIKSQTFKYKQLQFYCVSRSSNKGMFSTYSISVPKQDQMDDVRTKPIINITNSLSFKSPITQVELLDSNSLKNLTALKEIHLLALSKDCIKLINTQKIIQSGSKFSSIINLEQVQAQSLQQTFQISSIPFTKNINTMKSRNQNLLCGCDDGQIICIKLDEHLKSKDSTVNSTTFSFNKSSITDLTWIDDQESQNKFLAISKDGNGYLYDTRKPHPSLKLSAMHLQPTSIMQIRQNQFISSGIDCKIKFWDIRKQKSFNYTDNESVVTKMLNLTGKIGKVNDSELKQKDQSTRFATCGQNGTITIWQNQPQFLHMGHRSLVKSVNYSGKTGLFISSQVKNSKVCVWKPVLNTTSVQN